VLLPANQWALSTHSMGEVKVGTGSFYEFTHDVGWNSSAKLEHRDRLPSKVVQDIDLTTPSSSNSLAA